MSEIPQFTDIPCPECKKKKVVDRWCVPSAEFFCTNCHHYFTHLSHPKPQETQPPSESISHELNQRSWLFDAGHEK